MHTWGEGEMVKQTNLIKSKSDKVIKFEKK